MVGEWRATSLGEKAMEEKREEGDEGRCEEQMAK